MQEGDVIYASRYVRKELTDGLATLSVMLKAPLRTDNTSLVLLATTSERLDLNRLAVERIQVRLVVEGIDVARTAVHEEEDDRLRLGTLLRASGRERVSERSDAVCGNRLAGEVTVAAEQSR